jgi:gentisate 1,2-dioxygenase
MTGSGAYTTVNGDACDMEPGDLVLTPNWNWHDHNNRRDQPMVWFDGLDLPLVTTLESIFFENHPELLQPVAGANLSERTLSGIGLREAGAESPPAHSPLLRYRWSETDATLDAIHRARGGRHTTVEYVNPLTGAPAVATFGCEMHRVRPGGRTPTTRKTGSSIYLVFNGHGRSVISGEVYEWGPGDVFVTPSWATVDHEAEEVADLFAVTDAPVLKALHLYRSEQLAEQQVITGKFSAF